MQEIMEFYKNFHILCYIKISYLGVNFLNKEQAKKIIYKVSLNTIIINFLLTLAKLLAGIVGNSIALVSDAIHSASDVLSTVVVMLGAKLSSKKPDEKHPYGHEKFECIATIILSVMLFSTAITIGFYGLKSIFNKNIVVPSAVSAWAALLSIFVKEWMYRYTKNAAKKINSASLYADAWHHRSDSLSSIGSLIGVLGAICGLTFLDPLASFIICIIIIKVAYNILKTSVSQLIDSAAPKEVTENIKEIILSYKDIKDIDMLKTRLFGSKIYVDIEVEIDKNMSFEEVHSLIHDLHDEIEKSNTSIKHCMIHANPTR